MATPTTDAAPRSFDRARFYTIDTPTGPATSRCAGPRSPKGRLEPLLDLLDLKAVPAGDFRLPEGGIWRVYRRPGTQLDIDSVPERSTTVMIAFPDRANAPRSYEETLAAVNLSCGPSPDLVMRRDAGPLSGYIGTSSVPRLTQVIFPGA